jgi:hypothetical protein
MTKSFNSYTGADILKNPVVFIGICVLMVFLSALIAKGGVLISIVILLSPVVIVYIYAILTEPRVGLYGLFIYNFIALGLARYVDSIPVGMGVDAHLVIVYISLIFNSFSSDIPWKRVMSDFFILAVIWYGYSFFQLFNPEATSREAWFYAMRSVSLYMLLTIPLVRMLFNKKSDMDIFFIIWGVMSLLATFKGMMQLYIGVDRWEQAWLDAGSSSTHILHGKLRVFSFMSDAGQFGGAQGHAGVVFLILAFFEKRVYRLKVFYYIVGFMGLYGMMISGTRGSIAVPFAGFALFILLRKNIKAMIVGGLLVISIFVFFKYTYIGQGNPTISRMRTAFNPEDASLLVRIENQRKLKAYMASRPFGGGLGSSGGWGLRFSPNTFLANIPTDSWYVAIWAEQGIIGLLLHLGILFYIVIKSSIIIMFKLQDPEVKYKLSALIAGLFGIMAASYGNGVLGQMPTGVILYTSIAYLSLADDLNNESSDSPAKLPVLPSPS